MTQLHIFSDFYINLLLVPLAFAFKDFSNSWNFLVKFFNINFPLFCIRETQWDSYETDYLKHSWHFIKFPFMNKCQQGTEKAMAPHSSTLAWRIPWMEEPAVRGVAKSQTQLSDLTFTFHFHALEKEMATHSSVLAWRIPGMEEPGGLPSTGSHRVGHDWSDLVAAAAANRAKLPRCFFSQFSFTLVFCLITTILSTYLCFWENFFKLYTTSKPSGKIDLINLFCQYESLITGPYFFYVTLFQATKYD